jgi:uncharacterized membrane protein YhaH (DUF805 family)
MFNVFSTALAFKGRIGRASYWGLTSLCMLALFASSLSVALTANYTSAPPVNVIAVVVAIVGVLIFFVMSMVLFGTGVCRLHDRGKSGFWIVLYYPVPFILAVLAIAPEAQGIALNCIALAILGWAIIDLGILKAQPADNVYGSAAA